MTEGAAEPTGSERWQALAVLVLGAAIIGLAAILVRLSDAGSAATGFWRLVFAAPLLAAISIRSSKRPPASRAAAKAVSAE